VPNEAALRQQITELQAQLRAQQQQHAAEVQRVRDEAQRNAAGELQRARAELAQREQDAAALRAQLQQAQAEAQHAARRLHDQACVYNCACCRACMPGVRTKKMACMYAGINGSCCRAERVSSNHVVACPTAWPP
jgi:DNA repair exonuclease SbcCD ATPase subunit